MLYFLVGPSGVGKDSVLDMIKRHDFDNKQPIIVAHRYITRPPRQNDENHIELTRTDFKSRKESGLFLFHWKSHGYRYGIGKEVLLWLEAGHDVIINGSRKYIHEAREIYPDLKIIWLTVSEEILRERLIQRGRESKKEIEARIARTLTLNPSKLRSSVIIYNGQSIDKTAEEVIHSIENAKVYEEEMSNKGVGICV